MTGQMTVVYALEKPPDHYEKSLFLAGPTPRDQSVKSWRPQALQLLKDEGYDGVVYVPEDRPDANGVTKFHGNYDGQVGWEETHLHMADVILFWVPRDTATMPAFTTNDEWGFWKKSGKVVFGAPETAEKCRYQFHYAHKFGAPAESSLHDTVRSALNLLGKGNLRNGGEREVPLYIWRTAQFQEWYTEHFLTGNTLERVRVEWVHRDESTGYQVKDWVLDVTVHLAKENCDVSSMIYSVHL